MAQFETIELQDAAGAKLHSMMKVDGRTINTFLKPPEVTAEIIHNMVNLPVRDDDVMFCSAPKSGTHWGFEIISMLLNGKAETIPVPKAVTMLENVPQADLEKVSSPRVLNSHFPLCILPKQMKEKKTKIVLALRNPKDMVVSFFHHHKGMNLHQYEGKFPDYLQLFLEGKLEYGDWFEYIRGWEKLMKEGDCDIHLVYFEDLKENGLEEIKKIAKFLGVPENKELCKAIHDKCQFEKMVKEKAYKGEMAEKVFKNGFNMFRKGQIGDWKNYFTVAMSENFDRLYNEKMKDSTVKFRFTA